MREEVVDLHVCSGELADLGEHKCDRDKTHRVCARLLDDDGFPLKDYDFHELAYQRQLIINEQTKRNGVDSWCIDLYAISRLITTNGCENVYIRCDATDVDFVIKKYSKGKCFTQAKECLQKQCSPDTVLASLAGDLMPFPSPNDMCSGDNVICSGWTMSTVARCAVGIAIAAVVVLQCWSKSPDVSYEPMLG